MIIIKKASKSIKVAIISLLMMTTYSTPVAACNLTAPNPDDPASQLLQVTCPIERSLNILVMSSGVAYILFLLYGSIKYSLSQGDERAIMGARQTLTWATIGFVIVMGIYAIFNILLGALGVGGNFTSLPATMQGLLDWLKN